MYGATRKNLRDPAIMRAMSTAAVSTQVFQIDRKPFEGDVHDVMDVARRTAVAMRRSVDMQSDSERPET